jgi:PPK2 family polyphosphate:nucleotide phosphotransferase
MDIKKYKHTKKKSFKIADFKTNEKGEFQTREEAIDEFVENLNKINKLQQRLYAERKESVIFIFQAMDAAGKDGCIRTVFSTLTPHGVKEFCFKAPSAEELSHDYLWRFWSASPAKGHISIFNRSYYEDVLIGKVHKLYENQIVPERLADVDVIEKRYKEIVDFEKYLYNNGTRVVKIFLNVSKDEQAKRFISRIDTPRKNWKVSEGDLEEREYWDEYQEAFESMINNTSTSNSPWYVVPADHKWYARLIVSRIVLQTLEEINPQYPELDEDTKASLQEYREMLFDSLSYKAKEKMRKKEMLKKQSSTDESMLEDEPSIPLQSAYKDDENISNVEEKEKCKDKKKDNQVKKSKKNKKEKKSNKNKILESPANDSVPETEDAFENTVDIVTDIYIEDEMEKVEEKRLEENE